MTFFSELQRCEQLGRYIVEQQSTVRRAAHHFGISKSTVHKDVTVYLKKANTALFLAVREVLEQNKEERHLRGGEATRKKYRDLSLKAEKAQIQH